MSQNKYVSAIQKAQSLARQYFFPDSNSDVYSGGSRSWRNHNLGNVVAGAGSIGSDSRSNPGGSQKIFADIATGIAAQMAVLQEKKYQDKTIEGAIAKYTNESNPVALRHYVNAILAAANKADPKNIVTASSPFSSLNPAQLAAAIPASDTSEGYSQGTITHYGSNGSDNALLYSNAVPGKVNLAGATIINNGSLTVTSGTSVVIAPASVVNNGLITVGGDPATLVIDGPVTSDVSYDSSAIPNDSTEASGDLFTSEGTLILASGSLLTWTGTAAETGGNDWVGYSGSMASEILQEDFSQTQASADFSNTDLLSLGAPDNAQGLAIGPADPGLPTEQSPSTDAISYAFSSPVPAGTNFFLWDPGANDNGADGPYTFSFSASLNGVSVSTAGWSFSIEYPFNVQTGTDYSIDASSGVVSVSDYQGSLLPDAVIVVTPNTPIDSLTVTAETIQYDFWGLALSAPGPTLQIGDGSSLEFGDSVASNQTVVFGSDATLILDQPSAFEATISNFEPGDVINLSSGAGAAAGFAEPGQAIAYTSSGYYYVSFNNATNVLTVGDAAGATFGLQFSLGVVYSSTQFDFTSNGEGGTDITIPCYARGTAILCPHGEVPVEMLRPGDRVVTITEHGLVPKPIIWVGRRFIKVAGLAKPITAWPVRIHSGALREAVPNKDLYVSPDHALFLGGVLVHADTLINGATIIQERCNEVEYFHVELARHSILLANGTPAESYLDTGNRHNFSNNNLATFRPEFIPASLANGCAPFVRDGEKWMEIATSVMERTKSCGWSLIEEPNLHILADGIKIYPSVNSRGRFRFELPPKCNSLRLHSRVSRPSSIYLYNEDRRWLGVGVTDLRYGRHKVPLDHVLLTEGMHDLETEGGLTWRWTDGDARLPTPMQLGHCDVKTLSLSIVRKLPYWHKSERQQWDYKTPVSQAA